MNRLFGREPLALDNFRCRREVVHGHQYKIDEKQSWSLEVVTASVLQGIVHDYHSKDDGKHVDVTKNHVQSKWIDKVDEDQEGDL